MARPSHSWRRVMESWAIVAPRWISKDLRRVVNFDMTETLKAIWGECEVGEREEWVVIDVLVFTGSEARSCRGGPKVYRRDEIMITGYQNWIRTRGS